MPNPSEATFPSSAASGASPSRTWSLETPSLTMVVSESPGGSVEITSLRTPGCEWIAEPTSLFSMAGEDVTFQEIDDATSEGGDRLRLTGTLSPSGLTAAVTWTCTAEASVIVAEIEISNDTDTAISLGSLSSLHLAVPRDHAHQLNMLAGGRWDEAIPPRGYRLQEHALDEIGRHLGVGAAEDGRSSGEHLPWFALRGPDSGLLASLVWSGRWSLEVTRAGEVNDLSLGISDFARLLQPGARIALPSVVMAGFAGTLDDGANAWRRWVTRHWMPSTPEGWPWIQYNHWYAYYGDIDADRLLEEARLAAADGCEVFVIDDGWFRGRRPDSYVSGWGDWVEDRANFPDGLHAFGEQVRSLGMKFGLWVEPERADDSGPLVREHPGWIATSGGQAIYRPGPDGHEGVHLCLGNSEVQQWMAAEMIRVVRDYGVDWLKWDYNMGYGRGCDAPDHGHQATDGHHAHTHGLWAVLDALRAACPDLVIENCASGGHRVDLGMVRHSHTNWVSDYTHRAASCRQHAQGAGFFLPLAHVNTWTLEERDLTSLRSRMGGAFGVSSFMGEWSDREREIFRQAVAEYTRLRPYLSGDRYLLTGPWHGDWDIWQFVHPSGDAMALLAFRDHGEVSEVRVRPRVPEPDRQWTLRYEAGEHLRITGHDLAATGVTLTLPELGQSALIWLDATDDESAG